MGVRDWLSDPRVRAVDVDSPDLIDVHREILASKPIMRAVFGDFYRWARGADERYLWGDGLRVEIGAGSGLMKEAYPDVIITDVKPSKFVDQVVDALDMPWPAASVRTVYAMHTFHHLPDPDRFFDELDRVLVPGGGCVIIDPADTPFARLVYPRLFASEGYDMDQASWKAPDDVGVMWGANQALSYVVLVRDRELFERRHPGLELVGRRRLPNYPRYLASGGLNFRQLWPSRGAGLLRFGERVLEPVAPVLALHQMFVIRKRGGR